MNAVLSPTKKSKSKAKLPIGIRATIYSFLPLSTLIDSICRVSRYERKLIAQTDLMD